MKLFKFKHSISSDIDAPSDINTYVGMKVFSCYASYNEMKCSIFATKLKMETQGVKSDIQSTTFLLMLTIKSICIF